MGSACRLSTNVIRLSKSISKHSLRSFLHCAECVFWAPSDSAKFIAFWCKKNRRATGGIPHRKSYESRHTYACWALSAGANPNFIAAQMGHTSAQMVYSVYGKWMTDNNDNQLAILNANFGGNAPQMPLPKTNRNKIL